MSAIETGPQWDIVVLAGGDSAEREVSLRSGAAVAEALSEAGHHVSLVDPSACPLETIDWSRHDACFVALHGGAGEDGRIQQQLETLGVNYTGSRPTACRLAMSKSASKRRFVACRVPTPSFTVIAPGDSADTTTRRLHMLGYPLVIKPNAEGSSIGVSIVENADEVTAAVVQARGDSPDADHLVIAESFVKGREFTVAVLDERAFPLIEIVSPERLFSYEAKYASADTRYLFDFELSASKRVEISQICIKATRALGATGLSRVDVMLDAQGQPWVLEVNTIPGMTPRSLAPQAAARAGLPMPRLCDLLVRRCLKTGITPISAGAA